MIYPDNRLGRAAFENARANRFPLGARGAGMSVTVGNGFAFDRAEAAGQCAAFREAGGVKFFACVVSAPLSMTTGPTSPTTCRRKRANVCSIGVARLAAGARREPTPGRSVAAC